MLNRSRVLCVRSFRHGSPFLMHPSLKSHPGYFPGGDAAKRFIHVYSSGAMNVAGVGPFRSRDRWRPMHATCTRGPGVQADTAPLGWAGWTCAADHSKEAVELLLEWWPERRLSRWLEGAWRGFFVVRRAVSVAGRPWTIPLRASMPPLTEKLRHTIKALMAAFSCASVSDSYERSV